MLNTRLELTRKAAAELIAIEKNLDAALVGQAKLQAIAIEGRRNAKLPLHTGQAGLEQLASANINLIAARKAVHEAHLVFRQVQRDMGLGTVSFGDYGDTPDEFAPSGQVAAQPALAIVDAA
ncbi:hypothetical protein [Sphingomonas sp. GB1N7]|uniref:hypothetical protein n=1 Tax=Parasphingomonas caseinilytica TaxID=3096158 RepID=UPI002FC996B6